MMSSLAIALAVASVTTASPSDRPAADARLFARPSTCHASIDPQFVFFVPAAAAAGRNPLLRLIDENQNASTPRASLGLNSCKAAATRYTPGRPY